MSEEYDRIFGEKDRKTRKSDSKARGRKYGTHVFARQFMDREAITGRGGDSKNDPLGKDARGENSSVVKGKGSSGVSGGGRAKQRCEGYESLL